MKIVTINIPDQYLDCIETLVQLGFYPNRSEAVREALKQFLSRETVLNEGWEHETFYRLKKKQMELMFHQKL